jgi:uncharacterized RDD family membrane protein YckC
MPATTTLGEPLTTNLPPLEPIPIDDVLPHALSIAPVWRRLVAYLVDSFILGFVGFALGDILFETLARLGIWGRVVGFCVALVYFASLDSRVGNGQTIGKKCLKLRVADAKGNTISLAASLVRSAIFAAPMFLYGLKLSETNST